MSLLQALLLGIIQGITEFLPISSSGHLVLTESLLNLEVDQLKDFDVIVHVGTLLAILIYFRREVLNTKYWPYLIIGTIPAVIVGLTLENQIDAVFRSALSVGIVMIIVGLIFTIPEKKFKSEKKLTWKNAILIGIAQAVAIIPGVSRSGSTIFTATFLGLKREEAARFSFLLGSIAIAGAGLLTALDLSEITLGYDRLLIGFFAALFSGLFAVSWLMKYLKKHSLKTFGFYLIAIGTITILASIKTF
ncbi:undecaprenyl-diphosphate phosphatase [Candidatus Peregrinibacteria bacterium]|jgi:undecaprenyl-diphosphatase|nr:undecaprenyl-diphosphate phosphatase [Candidatus Peregrinibacteria bacterium]MBT5516535.1 undecaprenyl-diphosphate phosphatase [Candidatus Peregrinibacteria bacterium]MBT5823573.1 undecaprenyl-diphosphate phosphatase [Candidatus Peregrinibacteria bacterium]